MRDLIYLKPGFFTLSILVGTVCEERTRNLKIARKSNVAISFGMKQTVKLMLRTTNFQIECLAGERQQFSLVSKRTWVTPSATLIEIC